MILDNSPEKYFTIQLNNIAHVCFDAVVIFLEITYCYSKLTLWSLFAWIFLIIFGTFMIANIL